MARRRELVAAGRASLGKAETSTGQLLRAAASALYWARRRNPDGVRGSVAGLAPDEVRVVRSVLADGVLSEFTDDDLMFTMGELAAGKSTTAVDKHVSGELAKATATLADTGYVEGYASTWRDLGGADRQGDVVAPGAYRKSAEAINAGLVNVPLIAAAGHDWEDPTVVVGKVVRAVEDSTGLWVRATWGEDAAAQRLREIAKSGGYSFSVGGQVASSRPVRLRDGSTARELTELDLAHVLLTHSPANRSARVVTAKQDSALVVWRAEEIEAQRRRADPDRRRRQAEDRAIAEWLPGEVAGFVAGDPQLRSVLLGDMARAAAAKSMTPDAVQHRDRAAVARELDNRRCYETHRWLAEHAGHRRCRTGDDCDV